MKIVQLCQLEDGDLELILNCPPNPCTSCPTNTTHCGCADYDNYALYHNKLKEANLEDAYLIYNSIVTAITRLSELNKERDELTSKAKNKLTLLRNMGLGELADAAPPIDPFPASLFDSKNFNLRMVDAVNLSQLYNDPNTNIYLSGEIADGFSEQEIRTLLDDFPIMALTRKK